MSHDGLAAPPIERSSTIDLADWQTVPLCDVADISRGTSWASENERREPVDGALPVLGIKNVQTRLETGDLLWLYGLKPAAIASSTVRTGDILMVGSNGNPARIGNAVQIDEPGRYLFASLLFGLRPRRESVDPDFLYQALVAPGVQTAISDAVQGTTGLSNLKITTLRDLPVDLPPLDEQRRIAEVLRSVDEAIAANGDAVEQLRVTRDAIRDEHFRASGMDSYARTLGSVCDITKLAGFEYSKHIRYGESDEIIAVRGLNMKDGELSLDDVKTISRATSQALPRSALRKGDLVMSYVGTIGEVAMIDADDRYHLAPNVALLRCGEQALPEYILHFLYSRTGREEINKYVSTSSQQSLSMGKIRSFEIDLPSVDDQQCIVETMDTINASLTKGVQTQTQLLAQKEHLINDLLSGHVRVPA